MKHNFDTYRLYSDEKIFTYSARVRVRMKEKVDIDAMHRAANIAIKRYPYFAVKVVIGDDGGYDFVSNDKEVVVMTTTSKRPLLGSDEINNHLLYIDCDGYDIYFNISHSMCGGRGFMPWVMTNMYQYVVEKYGVTPHAPSIRKPDSDLLPGEDSEPKISMLTDEKPIYSYKSKKPVIMALDYLNGMYNPFMRDPNYYIFTFEQSDIMSFAKRNDASVASFFLASVAKSLDKILPKKYQVIGGEIAHNPAADIGISNSHSDFLTHVHIDYDRKYFDYDMDRLGTLTRSQIILQTDETVVANELRKYLMFLEEVDKIDGTQNKRAYFAKNNPSLGKGAEHGTFIVNYTGRMDWGEVADYIESYVIIVEGHILLEVTSMADKIFVSYMQLIKENKYVEVLGKVMDELKIPYKIEGPYKKNLAKHKL